MPRDRAIRLGAPSANGPRARVEADPWIALGSAPGDAVPHLLPRGALLVPLAHWLSRREELLARAEPAGVWLAAGDDPAALAPDLARLAMIAVHFPKFGDGRGYSTAVLLRTRLAYRGTLRAFGDIGRDHLFYLARCGFDSFRLPRGRDPDAALASLADFSLRYQGSVDDPLPLYRKRAPAGRMAP